MSLAPQAVAFQYLQMGHKKEGDGLFRMVCCERTRGNGFKPKKARVRTDIRNVVFCVKGREVLEQVASRGCDVDIA